MTDNAQVRAPSSMDRAPGFEPGDEGSIPSERADSGILLPSDVFASPHDYYIVATIHHKHYATYEEAKAALATMRETLGASTSGKKRKRGATQRIYRCHSFGRSCKEPPGDGAAPSEETSS